MIEPQTRKSPAATGLDLRTTHSQANHSPIGLLLHAIESTTGRAPTRTAKGWRARCPSCGGKSEKVSLAEADNGGTLLYAFCGCEVSAVLAACGLTLAHLFPMRLAATTPEARRAARLAMREAGWDAAWNALAAEADIVRIVAGDVLRLDVSARDLERVALAEKLIHEAVAVLNGR
jgi:hypothetical protein